MKKPAKIPKTAPHPNVQLKRARELNGWSQEHVGQQVGTDAFTVSRWERGITIPSPHFRQKLIALFAMSASELGLVPERDTSGKDTAGQTGVPGRAEAGPYMQVQIIDPAIPPLPAGEHGLVGRDELLRGLKERLLAGKRVALSALNGLPGVGKTALATVLAHDEEILAHFSDGVLWAGVGYEPDILGLLSRWGSLLNCAPDITQRSRPEAWATSIHAAIGQRRVLLIIDDAWEMAQALAFQVGGPNCSHLVTTRFPEIARRFAAEGAITVGELEETDGRLLLMRLSPEVVQAEPEESQALVAAVGGLPLALTLLGNFLRAQSHSGQPRRLRAAIERLRSAEGRLRLAEPQSLISTHPSLSSGTPLSLQAVIGISDQQVSEEARAALRALSVFPPKPNTFSEEAAIAVSALSVETLDELTDAGLVESSGPERYTLHQTIADYARTHLADTAVIGRLVAHFVAYVETHTLDYKALEAESSNILAALEAAFERKLLPELVRGVHAFAPSLLTRGLSTVAETQLQRSLAAAQKLNDAVGQATALLHLGKIAEQRGNYMQAVSLWQDGLARARASDSRRVVAQLLGELGTLAWQQGELQQSHQYLAESLAILRHLGEQREVANTLRILGHLAADEGQLEQARLLYEEARVLFHASGDRRGVALALNNLGIIKREQGQLEQAAFLYEEALTILQHVGDRHSSATVLNNLGHLARQQGQPELAYQSLNKALTIHRQLENPRGYAFTLLNIGNLLADQGHIEQARALMDEALPVFRDLQDQRNVAITLHTLGFLAREQQQFEQARLLFNEALTIFQELNDQRWIALTVREQAILAGKEHQPDQARILFEMALADFSRLGDRQEAASTHIELAILSRQQGRMDEAHQLLTDALATMRQSGNRPFVAQALKELGLLAQQQGRLQEAVSLFLCAAVGMELVASPTIREVEQVLQQLDGKMGKDAFLAALNQAMQDSPEPGYSMDKAAWERALRRLAQNSS